MKKYDVIVVGGGPAGGECARQLSKKGHSVLLVEQYKSFNDNKFSSAGMTLDPLKKYQIPEKVIASYWSNLAVQCSNSDFKWKGDSEKGVVLDFGKLREYLADESIANGGELLLGHRYMKKKVSNDKVIAFLKDVETKKTVKVEAKILVDATGPSRRVIYDNKKDLPELFHGVGLEYLIKVHRDTYDKVKNTLVFFLGDKWAPDGYSWIFPMDNTTLKIGYGKAYLNDEKIKQDYLFKDIILKIINEYLKSNSFEILDIHGGTLKYSLGLNDIFYKNRVVAVGDAVSTVNPFGGEGIQFAIENAILASTYIDKFLKNKKVNFSWYRRKWLMRKYFKWSICEAAAMRMYKKYDDKKIEKRFKEEYQKLDIDALINVLFNFNLSKVSLRVLERIFYKIGPVKRKALKK